MMPKQNRCHGFIWFLSVLSVLYVLIWSFCLCMNVKIFPIYVYSFQLYFHSLFGKRSQLYLIQNYINRMATWKYLFLWWKREYSQRSIFILFQSPRNSKFLSQNDAMVIERFQQFIKYRKLFSFCFTCAITGTTYYTFSFLFRPHLFSTAHKLTRSRSNIRFLLVQTGVLD